MTPRDPPPQTKEAVDWWLDKWVAEGLLDRKEPLTRQHVEKLIEVNGGTAQDLNLADRNMEKIDLDARVIGHDTLLSFDLNGASLKRVNLQGARLVKAVLQRTDLSNADLKHADLRFADFKGAKLWDANLEGADLRAAYLRGADLRHSNLENTNLEVANLMGVWLNGARIDRNSTRFRGANWGGKKMMLAEELAKEWGDCLAPYRDLKHWYQHHGDYDTAGKFHYREWECKRKLAQQENSWGEVVLLWLPRMLYGYGEHPWRVIAAWAAVIGLFSLLYLWQGIIPSGSQICVASVACWNTFATYVAQSLYFSGASFTALGYGDFVTAPDGWPKYLGVVESFIGVLLIALFLVTFTRKMTR